MAPRHAPDPPARRALEKLLAAARSDPLFANGENGSAQERLEALGMYCARAYQLGRDRGRREVGGRR